MPNALKCRPKAGSWKSTRPSSRRALRTVHPRAVIEHGPCSAAVNAVCSLATPRVQRAVGGGRLQDAKAVHVAVEAGKQIGPGRSPAPHHAAVGSAKHMQSLRPSLAGSNLGSLNVKNGITSAARWCSASGLRPVSRA